MKSDQKSMKRILITGATGNVGSETIRYLLQSEKGSTVMAGVRSVEKAKKYWPGCSKPEFVEFDFERPATFGAALQGISHIFLLRPPQLADVNKYFRPLISALKDGQQIVFLSVQGAERSKVIPHRRIENLILERGLGYIFLRPGYFMQNLTTTLLPDIRENRRIILPAGKAKFNWVDVNNIAEAAAILLENFEAWENKAYEITGYENKDFYTVAEQLSQALEKDIEYRSVNPLLFYWRKKQQGLPQGKILVMLLLHFLPRFQDEPEISAFYEKLTGRKPTSLEEFLRREKDTF